MNNYPFDAEEMLKKSRRMKRDLLADGTKRIHKKIAVLGGSTTHDIIRMMELFLLQQGIEPEFYESEYAQSGDVNGPRRCKDAGRRNIRKI